ncbi:MAG: hypothetical protein RIF32_04250 [Leptospirales bacterium]|jgi:hypothetical protein
MEIIYFIMVVFTESTLTAVQINAWHVYADEVGYDVPCERAIEDPKFQELMGRKLRPGQKATLRCKSDPEMRPLQFLLAPGAVRIKPTAAPEGQTKSEDGAPRVLSGKLTHMPYESGRKSKAAYMGQEFFLETRELGRVALYATESVSKAELLKRVGKKISVEARFVDRTPTPDQTNMIQYPIGEDGGPMKRAGYEVLKFK